MASNTLAVLSEVISDVCGINRDKLTPEVNALEDLGIDSVDMLDVMYEMNRRFNIKIPAEQWSNRINSGAASTGDYFVLSRFAGHIDELAEARRKSAG